LQSQYLQGFFNPSIGALIKAWLLQAFAWPYKPIWKPLRSASNMVSIGGSFFRRELGNILTIFVTLITGELRDKIYGVNRKSVSPDRVLVRRVSLHKAHRVYGEC